MVEGLGVAEEHELADYLSRPMTPPESGVLEAIAGGPIEVRQALALSDVAQLLDPRPLDVETGWCTLRDGVGFVAVRTAMPLVSGEMVDWWFDWHPREALRYRVWHPAAHRSNSLEPPHGVATQEPGAKAHWGAVHHPVEDVGIGVVHARIAFQRPSEMGLPGDQLENPDVAGIVCGYVGDDRRRVRHTPMFHVFLQEGNGVVLRSAFWLGAAVRPYGALGAAGERVLNNRLTRRAALPRALPRALRRGVRQPGDAAAGAVRALRLERPFRGASAAVVSFCEGHANRVRRADAVRARVAALAQCEAGGARARADCRALARAGDGERDIGERAIDGHGRVDRLPRLPAGRADGRSGAERDVDEPRLRAAHRHSGRW